jgi:hypothetical protein
MAMGADGAYYFARGSQANVAADGDAFTVGDFSGPTAMSYKPVVGKVVITNDGSTETQTPSGPAHQPSCNGRSFFSDIDVSDTANAGAGRVYATGYGYTASGGTMDSFDPDGPGTDFAPIAFSTSTTGDAKGFAVVYNATTWAIDKVVTWESTYGDDICTDITATASGGFVLVGQTLGSLGGKTNPTEGTNDGYLEVYNADGSLAWNFQTETSATDNFGDATVDADGNIYVSGNRDSDAVVWKFDSAGNLVWTTIVDNGGTSESQRDHAGDKHSIFLLSQYNPSAGGTPWANTISYTPRGNNEVLLQKLSPGDFTSDGVVDTNDLDYLKAAVATPLTGVDTYDFDGDGDSTLADYTYFWMNILNIDPPAQDGDFNGDGSVEAGDLALLLANWGQNVQPGAWTSNWDGFVDANELAALLGNWGAGLSSAPLLDMAAINAVVPEPATMTLLALGGLVALRRRK